MQQLHRCQAVSAALSAQCDLEKWHDGLHVSNGDSFHSDRYPCQMVTSCNYCTPTTWGTHDKDCPKVGTGQRNPMPSKIPDVDVQAELREALKTNQTLLEGIAKTLEDLVKRLVPNRPQSNATTPGLIAAVKLNPATMEVIPNAPKRKSGKGKPLTAKQAKEARSKAAFAAAATRRRRASASGRS